MAKKLRNIRLRAVALVDKGANEGAHIMLAKRDSGEPMPEDPKLPEDIEKRLKDAEAALAKVADLEKRATAAEADAKTAKEKAAALEEAEIAKRYVEKAREFGGIPGLSAKPQLLRKFYATLTADEAKEADEVFRAASNSIQASQLLTEVGTVGGYAGSAYEKLDKMAKDRATKDGTKYEVAFAKVSDTDEGRALLRQHEKERDESARRNR